MNKQKGSAHVIIIICLAIALFGTLGFVFWQNFIAKDSSNSSVKKSASVTDGDYSKESSGKTITYVSSDLMSSDNLGVTYKMPSSWAGGKYGGGDTISETESTTLTSPDGFVITMTISRLIRGWEYDSPAATVLDVQNTTGTELKWVTVDHSAGTTGPINLQIADSQTLPGVGDKKVAGSSIYKLGEVEGSGVYLEMYGGYQKDMPLADFNAKQSVGEAKSIFESVKVGL